MQKYTIYYTFQAKSEIADLYYTIVYELMSPLTANRYIDGILKKIHDLETIADVFAPSLHESLRQEYGEEVRTITYKKMTIIYNIIGDVVLIRRVMASSLIR